MTAETYFLVIVSAAAHAYWNFLLKRSGATQAFVGLSKGAEAVMLAPFLVSAAWSNPALLRAAWLLPVVGAVLVIANYALLTAAYGRGALSVVYPISRAATLMFLPPLALIVFGERPDAIGGAALVVILLGMAALQLPGFARSEIAVWGRSLRSPATLLALLAGLVAAVYTIWDKRAVQTLAPITYFAAYTVLVGAAYVLFLRRTEGDLRGVWRAHRAPLLQVAVLNSMSYLLVLAALRTGNASYVIALRQLSIAAGAALGWLRLGEPLPAPRRWGIALVVAGCMLLAIAR